MKYYNVRLKTKQPKAKTFQHCKPSQAGARFLQACKLLKVRLFRFLTRYMSITWLMHVQNIMRKLINSYNWNLFSKFNTTQGYANSFVNELKNVKTQCLNYNGVLTDWITFNCGQKYFSNQVKLESLALIRD